MRESEKELKVVLLAIILKHNFVCYWKICLRLQILSQVQAVWVYDCVFARSLLQKTSDGRGQNVTKKEVSRRKH